MFESKKTPTVKLGAPHRTVLFLDIDDVLCLSAPYGGYDVAQAFAAPGLAEPDASRGAPPDPWQTLLLPNAVSLLRAIHDEFQPQYVISSDWWWLMEDHLLRRMLQLSALDFVDANLHPDMSTPKGPKRQPRWTEIKAWLDAHREAANNWVVLDDYRSGTGLDIGQPPENLPVIVLCTESVGLTDAEYALLRTAFELRREAISAAV